MVSGIKVGVGVKVPVGVRVAVGVGVPVGCGVSEGMGVPDAVAVEMAGPGWGAWLQAETIVKIKTLKTINFFFMAGSFSLGER